jgi:Raf kinase inhibitor-like YbhB/YbcL family protein
MIVYCPILRAGKFIPTRHANRGVRGGDNISLPVTWNDPPPATESFLLLIVDRHPMAHDWLHWCVMNIPASDRAIPENVSRASGPLPPSCVQLRNSFGEFGYGGPQPPKGSGPHEYEITVHALNVATLPLAPSATLSDITKALSGRILASASTSGYFEQ